MPSLGADMDSGTLLEWRVEPGDHVQKGDIVAVVDTAKAAVDVETFVGGTVEELVVEPGTHVPVGTVLARIVQSDDGVPDDGAPLVTPPDIVRQPSDTVASPAARPTAPATGAHVTPLVRALARRLRVDVTTVRGTGHDGAVTRADVERAAARASAEAPARARVTPYARRLAGELGVDIATLRGAEGGPVRAVDVRAATSGTAPTPAVATSEPASPPPVGSPETVGTPEPDRGVAMRAAIARAMSRANTEIPQYYLSTTVDMGRATDWLRRRNRELPVQERLVAAALLLKATATAVLDHPSLNGVWSHGEFRQADAVHLGVAVSLRGGGLVAPALHDAQTLTVEDLMAALRDVVTRVRSGRLTRAELADPTLTVTNLGDLGVEQVFGVIYPPQVALVGFGTVVDRPWAVDGMLGVRPTVTATLAADHRVSDGYTGARFLAAVNRLLQSPEEL